MKKVFVFLVAVVFLLIASFAFAGDMHKVQLQNIEPFSIGTEFPQKVEGPFNFSLYASNKFGSLDYRLVIAQSLVDPNYKLLLLCVTLDEGKTIHVVATMSTTVKNEKSERICFYKDEQFFAGKGFSGILVPTPKFPGPDDIEKVAPAKKLGI